MGCSLHETCFHYTNMFSWWWLLRTFSIYTFIIDLIISPLVMSCVTFGWLHLLEMCCAFRLSRCRWYRISAFPSTGAADRGEKDLFVWFFLGYLLSPRTEIKPKKMPKWFDEDTKIRLQYLYFLVKYANILYRRKVSVEPRIEICL